MAELCDFEKQREERVKRNAAVLAALVAPELRELPAPAPRAGGSRRASAPRAPTGPVRRSVRAEGRPAVNYAADLDALEARAMRRPRDGPPRYTRARLTLEELEAMTEEEREKVRALQQRRVRARRLACT